MLKKSFSCFTATECEIIYIPSGVQKGNTVYVKNAKGCDWKGIVAAMEMENVECFIFPSFLMGLLKNKF